MEVVSSEKRQKGFAKVVEWYGGKDKYLLVSQNPVSKEVAGEYGFVMKQLTQIQEEKGFMLAQAQYYRNEKVRPIVDEKYGSGASEFFAQAIEAFWGVLSM